MLSENIYLGALTKLRKATIIFVPRLSVRRYGTIQHPLDGFSLKLLIGIQKFVEKNECHSNRTRISGTLHEVLCLQGVPEEMCQTSGGCSLF
jgi:hypothetical protein